jgi:hypothetical protein
MVALFVCLLLVGATGMVALRYFCDRNGRPFFVTYIGNVLYKRFIISYSLL